MPRLEMFPLNTWIRFFSNTGAQSLERIQEALEKLENEKYSPEKFMSDSVLMWADLMNGWWNAVRQSISGPVPTVFMKVLSDDQAGAQRDIPVDAIDTDGKIECTPPVRLGEVTATAKMRAPSATGKKRGLAAAADMSGDNLQVGWHPGKKRCLRVDVHRILPLKTPAKTTKKGTRARAGEAQKTTPRFNPGLYQSLVHVNGKLLAQVMILVEEKEA